jgi:hypothetical protein
VALLDRAVRRVPADRFAVVLALLVGAYLLNVLTERTAARLTVMALYLVAVLFGLATARPSRRLLRGGLVVTAIATVSASTVAASLPAGRGWGALNAAAAVMLLVTLLAVVSRVISHEKVTLQTIAGAVSAYLLIGLMFAAAFGLLAVTTPGDFFAGGQRPTPELLQYFSLTTLTTLGYGDLTAASAQGRGLAMLEALGGQVFLVTLVASLVGAFQRDRRRHTSHPES